MTAGMVAVGGPLFIAAARGERSLPLLLAIGTIAGVGTYIGYELLGRWRGIRAVEISPEGVLLEDRRGRRSLAWADVTAVHHTYYGGERWGLRAAKPHRALQIPVDGFRTEDRERIASLIRAHGPG